MFALYSLLAFRFGPKTDRASELATKERRRKRQEIAFRNSEISASLCPYLRFILSW